MLFLRRIDPKEAMSQFWFWPYRSFWHSFEGAPAPHSGLLHRVNGKFRADNFTIMTIHTTILFLYCRRVVTFLIEFCGKLKNIPWTILNTVPASLAAIVKDMHHPSRNLDFIHIKWNSPEWHDLFPFLIKDCNRSALSSSLATLRRRSVKPYTSRLVLSDYHFSEKNVKGNPASKPSFLRHPYVFFKAVSIFLWAS